MIPNVHRPTRGSVIGGVLIGLAILAGCLLFLGAFASLLHAQEPSALGADPGLGQLAPSLSAAVGAIASVAFTGYLVKGTTSADSWWQQHVIPKVKPLQPVIALGTSLGLAILGQKLGIAGLATMNDVLLQSPTATIAAIAVREGIDALNKQRRN